MNLTPIFDEDEEYTPSDLAALFDVTSHTIRNWANDGKLSCDRTSDGRVFYGHQVMRDIKQSDHLQSALREAHMAENGQDENDYIQTLESTIDELETELEQVRGERDQLRDESMQVITKLADTIERQDDRIQSLEETVENRLPEPEDDDESDGGWWIFG